MSFGTRGPSKWFMLFCLVLGVVLGFVTAGIAMSFWSVAVGEDNRGLFLLIWMFAAVVFFAWPMHIAARAQAIRRQKKIMRERIGDLDYEPSPFPFVPTPPPSPGEDLEIKAPDIKERGLGRFLPRGRTAEQRMADYLATVELKAELQRAKEPKTEDQSGSQALE